MQLNQILFSPVLNNIFAVYVVTFNVFIFRWWMRMAFDLMGWKDKVPCLIIKAHWGMWLWLWAIEMKLIWFDSLSLRLFLNSSLVHYCTSFISSVLSFINSATKHTVPFSQHYASHLWRKPFINDAVHPSNPNEFATTQLHVQDFI